MHRSFEFIYNMLLENKKDQTDLCVFSKNEHRAFLTSPNQSANEDEGKSTRLFDERIVSVCLILYQPTVAIDQTIYGKEVCYPPPPGVTKAEVKQRILEATLPIPASDYDKFFTPLSISGNDYTKVIKVILYGSVYTPVNNVGYTTAPRRYSFNKGWYKC